MAHLPSIYVGCDRLTHGRRIIAKYLYLFASIIASWDWTVAEITRDQMEENIMAAVTPEQWTRGLASHNS